MKLAPSACYWVKELRPQRGRCNVSTSSPTSAATTTARCSAIDAGDGALQIGAYNDDLPSFPQASRKTLRTHECHSG